MFWFRKVTKYENSGSYTTAGEGEGKLGLISIGEWRFLLSDTICLNFT